MRKSSLTVSLLFSLARLQSVDSESDEQSRRLREIEQRLSADPAVASARAALSSEEKQLNDDRASLRARELEAQTVDAKIKELELRLYGGRVSNPKELEGLEKDLQMHKRQRSHLDDELLDLMDRVEAAQKRLQEKRSQLDQATRARARDVEALEKEKELLSARLEELGAERQRLRGGLEAQAIRSYDQLRRTKGGRAVAPLRNGACSACGVATPTGLLQRVQVGNEIVFCPGCGRILSG